MKKEYLSQNWIKSIDSSEKQTSRIQCLYDEIIFDLDGTLVHSFENIHQVNQIVFSQALQRNVTLQEAQQKFHHEFGKIFLDFNIHDAEQKKLILKNWGKVSQNFQYQLFPGIKNLLQRISGQGVVLHLWTARDADSARDILQKNQILAFFKTLSFATESLSKPNPQALQFNWAQCRPGRLLMVGDSVTDIKAAQAVGATSAVALWDASPRDVAALQRSGADLFFQTPSAFEKWLIP